MKRVLIGGGTGFIGTRLSKLLKDNGYAATIISRMPGLGRITWHEVEKNGLGKEPISAVVNLCGQNVLDPTRRWTAGFKQNVWNSRINTSASLVKAITHALPETKPDVFVNISGVSCYKPDDKKVYTEDDKCEKYDFFSDLCIEWEKAATLNESTGVRNVKLRTGVVLGREGGMIKSLYLPFFFGAGGPVGEGNQILPWIHIDDLCSLILYSIENKKVDGVLNAVAPDIVTNKDFAKAFGRALWRPALIPLPEFVVNFMFSEERAVLLTKGAKIHPKRTLESGFKYQYPKILEACKSESRLFLF